MILWIGRKVKLKQKFYISIFYYCKPKKISGNSKLNRSIQILLLSYYYFSLIRTAFFIAVKKIKIKIKIESLKDRNK